MPYDNDDQPLVELKKKAPLTWQILNQRHDCYDADRIHKLNLLLKGGYEIVEEAQLFMPKWKAESHNAYKDRLSFAAYENNFGEIINDFGSTLFSKPLAVLEAQDAEDEETPGEEPDPNSPHMQWQRHFTLDDQTMVDFMHCIQTESNATSCSYFGVDFQNREVDGVLQSLPYAYYIDPCSVLDWEMDEEGHFVFLVIRDDDCRRTNVRQIRNMMTTTFTVWTRDPETGKVEFDQYAITYPKDQEPRGDQPVPHLASPNEELSFKHIPIVDCRTPDNIAVGQLIGQLAGSLYMRTSTFLFCLNRGLNPLLAYTQGAELPANGDLSVINEDDDRGEYAVNTANIQGKAVLGPNDTLEWVEIKGTAMAVAQEQLRSDKNEMYRLVSSLNSLISNQGVSTAQTKSSGVAKMMDNAAKEHLLEAYAKLVKEWIIRAFELVFEALENDVQWQCKGMDNYKVVDEEQLMAKITSLPEYKTNMPSKTSYQQVLLDTAYQMHPFTNVGTMSKIQQEIKDNVEKMDLDSMHQSINPQGTLEADSAKQLDKAVPQAKAAGKPTSDSSDPEPKEIGDSGHQVSPPDSHLQTGEHVDPAPIYQMLLKDYKPENLAWVKSATWRGPMEVDAKQISFAGEEEWKANQDGPEGKDKVDQFSKVLADQGFSAFNPVILANMPHNNDLYTVIDGRHRVKAAQQTGIPIVAYIADVGSMDEDTDHMQMHAAQLKHSS
jgi:hypothetical protein